MASLDCERVSLPVHSLFLSAFCHLFPRQQRYKLHRKEKKGKGKSARCTFAEQTLKDWLPGMRGGGGGWWGWCGGSCWGRKADAWCGSGSLQIEERPFPLPFPLSFSLYLSSLLSIWCSWGESISISSCLASHRKILSVALCASLCRNGAMRRSSVDKLPPPASFFTTAASSSNTYALTQNPCALLGNNKNNRWAPGRRDGKTERANGGVEWVGVGSGEGTDEENKRQQTLPNLVFDRQAVTQFANEKPNVHWRIALLYFSWIKLKQIPVLLKYTYIQLTGCTDSASDTVIASGEFQ